MRLPVRYVADGLGWGYDGSVWATLRVTAADEGQQPASRRLEIHGDVRSALMSLDNEFLILGLCEPVSPLAVAASMVDRVDPDAHRGWAGVVSTVLATLEQEWLWRRAIFVTVKLADGTGKAMWGQALRSAEASLGVCLGMPAPPVARSEVELRRLEAAELVERLGRHIEVRAATAYELMWIYRRAFTRGVDDPYLDDPTALGGDYAGPVGEGGLIALAEGAALLEGGARGDPGRPRRHRRYLRAEVETADGDVAVAYQTFAAISTMPSEWIYPGGMGEWFPRADELGFPLDWCARVTPMANGDARKKIGWQHKQLMGQIPEYGGVEAPPELAESIEALEYQQQALAANAAEPDLPTTVFFSLWSHDLRQLEQRAKQLKELLEPDGYGIHRPTGGQTDLFAAMLPGSALPPTARHYTQFLLCGDLASGSPFSGSEVGDPRGIYVGTQIDGNSFRPVLLDPAYGPEELDQGSSIGLLGAQGAGKSHLFKLIIAGVLLRGGNVVTLDRTEMREYSRLGAGLAPMGVRTQIVDLVDPAICLDPLRIFAGAERLELTLGFLTVLLGTGPLEVDGMELADAVGVVVGLVDGRMADVIDVLEATGAAGNEVAREVARKLNIFSKTRLGQIVFGDRPALRLGDADYIVFAASRLNLPTKDQVMHAHLAKQLLPEQILGQALLYLVAAVTRRVAYGSGERFTLGAFDEAWGMTVSPQGEMLLKDVAHGGRKEMSAVMLAGQDAVDFGTSELPDLIPVRMVFRHESTRGAKRALEFLDLPDDNGELTRMICDRQRMGTGDRPRLCLIRDIRNRVGLLQITPAWTPQLAAAMESNAKRVAQADRAAAQGDNRGIQGADSPGAIEEVTGPVRRLERPRAIAAARVAAPSRTPARIAKPVLAEPGRALPGAGVGTHGERPLEGIVAAATGRRPGDQAPPPPQGNRMWAQVVAGATGTRAVPPAGRPGARRDLSVPPSRRAALRNAGSTDAPPERTA